MIYLIGMTLTPCTRDDRSAVPEGTQYVAVLTSSGWAAHSAEFDMGIDLEPDATEILNTKAEVNFDSITGTFSIPDRNNITGEDNKFAFALDEKGIVFIDDTGSAAEIVERIAATRRWRYPGLERFIFDFIEQIIHGDLAALETREKELDFIEKKILEDDADEYLSRLNEIRGDMSDLRSHYTQLIGLAEELQDNENGFFKPENVRYFDLICGRVSRLDDKARSIWDYTVQLRDLYQAHLDVRQNHVMTILTVVTAIFMPLTLITGWYGMNFHNMPELSSKYGYLTVILISLCIIVGSLIYFKKKKWL